MKSIDLLKAINDIDDKYVEEAMPLVHKKRKRRPSFFLQLLPTFFILLLAVCLSLRLIKDDKELSNNETMATNPIVSYQTLKQAQNAIGFDFNIDLSKYNNLTYSVINDEILEISYNNNDDYLICRKSKGNDDNSGDFNTYDIVSNMVVNGVDVSMESNNDKILVRFTYKDYSYSFSSNYLNESELVKLVEEITK